MDRPYLLLALPDHIFSLWRVAFPAQMERQGLLHMKDAGIKTDS